MPIGDLLAQINGGETNASSSSKPTFSLPRTNLIPAKRKPDNDLRGFSSKVHPASNTGQPSRVTDEVPSILQRTSAGHNARLSSAPPAKTDATKSKAENTVLTGRLSTKPSSASTTPKAPPKKGSFAEILARGQRAQAVMGQVGKIQHKKVEKGATRTKEAARASVQVKGKSSAAYKGVSSKSIHRNNGTNGNSREGNSNRQKAVGPSKRAAQEDMVAKKVKKAAQATTGYTGTARPKTGISAKKDAPRGGALLNAPVPRHNSSKRSRIEDDYDEEMDDFIEYDDDDEDAPRYGYDSDGSSDMEAGMNELDREETRAEYIARQEDIKEERLEKSLKAAKEERKRKALETLRAGKRH